MLMIGDFGRDLDDEKALVMAVAMRRVGLIGALSIITNLGDTRMRARLAKGTANALGAYDVRVASGSAAGRHDEEDASATFDACPYLASEDELWGVGEHGAAAGHELVFDALRAARASGQQLTIVLNSALTDMAAVLRDPRWDELAPGVVSHIAAMGGTVKMADGHVRMDPEANNNAFDTASARHVYETLLADPRFWFLVVTRHAAAECQLPRGAFDGSSHPVALRLTRVQRPSLLALWQRCHKTEVERLVGDDDLPMRCNPTWFAEQFLEADAPKDLGKQSDIWPYVRGFCEYDGLTTVVAATATHPELFTMFFTPYRCPNTHTLVIGSSARENGIIQGRTVSDLLHYLMATSMSSGAGEWFGRLCDPSGTPVVHSKDGSGSAGGSEPPSLLMVGDFGKDQDDEKALIIAVMMRRAGLVGELYVVTNLGDARMRARLAKGTANALGAHDVRVASGSAAGRHDEEIHDYEFDACPYLANASEVSPSRPSLRAPLPFHAPRCASPPPFEAPLCTHRSLCTPLAARASPFYAPPFTPSPARSHRWIPSAATSSSSQLCARRARWGDG